VATPVAANGGTPPPVAADPVRWNRPGNLLVLAVVEGAAIALTIGLSVGLAANRSTPTPARQPPQLYDVSEDVLDSFLQGLPPAFVESIDSPGTPHARAFDWLSAHPPLLAGNESQFLLRVTQRFALASFFYSHGGGGLDPASASTWREADGWLDYTRNECEWHGCDCRHNLYSGVAVATIDIHQNALVGRFSSPAFELDLLRDWLTNLALPDNSISGPLPTEIGRLTTLATLWLDGNAFSGTLPTELGELGLLKVLGLGNNRLSGTIPSQVGELGAVYSLFLVSNALSGTIPTELGRLTSLTDLRLGLNMLSRTIPTELGLLSRLSILWLFNNSLTGTIPTELALLTNLQELLLYSNLLNGTVPDAVCALIDKPNGGLVLRLDCNLVRCDCGCECIPIGS
jgi:hypothetical protein